jgi:hypothetical protein
MSIDLISADAETADSSRIEMANRFFISSPCVGTADS